MYALLLMMQGADWLRWVVQNWVALFSMLAMLSFIAIMIVLALAPDSKRDDERDTHLTGGAPSGSRSPKVTRR